MKKTALIVSGEYRTFETVSKFWNIPSNYDLYFSTWDYSKENRKFWTEKIDGNWKLKSVPYLNTTSDRDLVASFEDEYKHHPSYRYNLSFDEWIYDYQVDSRFPKWILDKTKYLKIHSSEIYKNNNWQDFRKQIFHWKSCLKVIEKNWAEYDSIMFYRIDSIIWISQKSFDWFEENTLVTPSNTELNNWSNYQDNWFGGKKEVIKKFIDCLSLENPLEVHGDIASLLKNEVKVIGSFKHKSINDYNTNDLHYEFVRRGIVTWLDDYYESKFKHNACIENLPQYNEEYQYLNQYTKY